MTSSKLFSNSGTQNMISDLTRMSSILVKDKSITTEETLIVGSLRLIGRQYPEHVLNSITNSIELPEIDE